MDHGISAATIAVGIALFASTNIDPQGKSAR
jgi:hypothetical protein